MTKATALATRRTGYETLSFGLLTGALVLTPLAISTSQLYYDITPKVVGVLVAGAAGALFLALRSFELRADQRDRLFLGALALHAIVLILATILSTSTALSFGGGVWRRFGVSSRLAVLIAAGALFLILRRSPEKLRWLLRAFAVGGCLASIYAICQYFRIDPWIDSSTYSDSYWNTLRPPSTMGQAIYFAVFCLQIGFWALHLVAIAKTRIDRVLGYTCAGLCFFALLLSGTRAALLGVLAGAIVVMFRGKRAWRSLLPILIAVGICIALYLSPSGGYLRNRVTDWTTDAGGTRLQLWSDSFGMGLSRFLTGFGLESFSPQFPLYQSVQLAAAYPEHLHESAHNIVLDVFLEQGIVGLLALGMLIFITLRHSDRRRSSFLIAALAGALVTQQFMAFTVATYLLLMVNLALLASVSFSAHDSPAAQPTPFNLPRWPFMILGVVFLGLAARYWARDSGLVRVNAFLDDARIDAAIDSYAVLDRSPLLGEPPDLWLSRKLTTSVPRNSGQASKNRAWAEAVDCAQRAKEASEQRFNAAFQLSLLWALADDAPKTEENLRLTIAWAPRWYKPHWYLSKLFTATGRDAEAAREKAIALSLVGDLPLD
jgi:O-antigen ligase